MVACIPLAYAFRGGAARGNPSKCLTRFAKTPALFDRCKTTPCLIFLAEDSFIQLDKSMKTDAQQVPFRCSDPRGAFPGLTGAMWNILKATATQDAWCIWGGAASSFDDMTAFVTARANSHPLHQFGVASLLLESPSRVSETLSPSISLVESKLVIVGLRDHKTSFLQLAEPFQTTAWALFWAMAFVLCAFGAVIVGVFAPENFRWDVLFFHVMGEGGPTHPAPPPSATPATTTAASTQPPTPVPSTPPPVRGIPPTIDIGLPQESLSSFVRSSAPLRSRRSRDLEEDRLSGASAWGPRTDGSEAADDSKGHAARYKLAVWLFRSSTAAFILIFVLFYEIAVVNVVVNRATTPKTFNIKRLSKAKLKQFAVLESSGIEDIWRKTADPFGKFSGVKPPWYQCPNSPDCFNKILDPEHPVRFTVTFDNFAYHHMRNKCHKLVIFDTENELYLFGAGWLFGQRIPADFQRKVGDGILMLRMSGELGDLARGNKTEEQVMCPKNADRIDGSFVGVALLILVGPCFLILTGVLGVVTYQRYKVSPRQRPGFL